MSEVKTTLVTNAVEHLPVLDEVPEGATLIAEVDGEFYRVKGEGVGGLVKVAVFKGDQYDATVASLAAGASRPTTVWDAAFECINMTHSEALAHIQSGKVLTALILTNGNSQLRPQTLPATVRYVGSKNLPDLIEVFAYDDAGDNNESVRTCLRWTADSITYAFTRTNKEPTDAVPEWA